MKVVHICLAAFYIDNYSYQENIIPKVHLKMGIDVKIIASTESYLKDRKLGYLSAGSYMSTEGIPIVRLPYIKWLPHSIVKKLRVYRGLSKELISFSPDIIFLHNPQFYNTNIIRKYIKENQCKLFVDTHTDEVNSAKNFISKNILHKVIYKYYVSKIKGFTSKFFATLPSRSIFLQKYYDVPKEKIEILEFGFDDTEVPRSTFTSLRKQFRENNNIKESDICFLMGGKFDGRKNLFNAIEAFNKLDKSNTYLIVFGEPTPENQERFKKAINSSKVLYLGWLNSKEINEVVVSVDAGLFPGTHSTIWEQLIGASLPVIIRRWPNMEHLDIGGNCKYLENGTTTEIFEVLSQVLFGDVLFEMKEKAIMNLDNRFLYSDIAKRSIGYEAS